MRPEAWPWPRRRGNVRAAYRAMGIHPSTYYRWRKESDRFGLEILRPRERRQTRMADATSPMLELRVLAFALAFPGLGRCGCIRDEEASGHGGRVLSLDEEMRVTSPRLRPGSRSGRSLRRLEAPGEG